MLDKNPAYKNISWILRGGWKIIDLFYCTEYMYTDNIYVTITINARKMWNSEANFYKFYLAGKDDIKWGKKSSFFSSVLIATPSQLQWEGEEEEWGGGIYFFSFSSQLVQVVLVVLLCRSRPTKWSTNNSSWHHVRRSSATLTTPVQKKLPGLQI